jgi:hypothetical protein
MHFPMFLLISNVTPKVLVLRPRHTTAAPPSQAASSQQPTTSSFSKSFIYTCKQGGGAMVLGEGHDIVTRETWDSYSLKINILGKAAVLHYALTPFCSWGCANSACRLLDVAMLMSSSHRLLILCLPTGVGTRKGGMRVNMVDVFCIHIWK